MVCSSLNVTLAHELPLDDRDTPILPDADPKKILLSSSLTAAR